MRLTRLLVPAVVLAATAASAPPAAADHVCLPRSLGGWCPPVEQWVADVADGLEYFLEYWGERAECRPQGTTPQRIEEFADCVDGN